MITNKPTGDLLPHIFIEYSSLAIKPFNNELFVNSAGLSIDVRNLTQTPILLENEKYLVFILGNPILGEKISHKAIADKFLNDTWDKEFLCSLNGEFLIVCLDKKKKLLHITNDRFTSIPLYYASDAKGFMGSVFYNDLWRRLSSENRLRLNQEAFFEFLWLQRLLGTKTYDTASRFLPAATTLTYDGKKIAHETYWSPSFKKTTKSLKECSVLLAESLKRSLGRKMSDEGKRYGLFLSGGIDSRTVLAAFDKSPVCFTFAVSKNNEYQVAREVAKIKNSQHIFIQLNPDPYSARLDLLVQLGGGMYAFDHALFFGFKDAIAPFVDVIFHGHGIDYLFQGMYVPTARINFGLKRPSIFKLRTLSNDFISDYLSTIPYRLKGVRLLDFVKEDCKDKMYESLRESLREVTNTGKKFCNSPYDYWEYTLIHSLSRHYPNTNLSSMATCVEQRTATFDNDIFNLYLSLPVEYRLNAKIARMTLKHLNPQMAKVRTGNTNIRADFSPLQRELCCIGDGLMRKARLRKGRAKFWPSAEERTWPDRGAIIKTHPRMKQAALDLCGSETLAELNFLDMDKLSQEIPKWINQPQDSGAFMTFLITLDRFLKQ